MNYKLLVETALLTGEIMLGGGAETYRVEDTLTRILKLSGLRCCDVFVVSTSIVVTLDGDNVDGITRMGRIMERSTNLGNIYCANDISRKLCAGKLTLEEANEKLQAIKKLKRYPDWLEYICMIITSAAFTMLLGATPLECLLAGLNGVFIVISGLLSRKIKIHRFVNNMCVCAAIATVTMVLTQLLHLNVNMEPIIAGSMMPLLPGVALTNAIRDTLQGDYVSGSARLVEAFVIAASLAVGIGAGLALGKHLLGGIL